MIEHVSDEAAAVAPSRATRAHDPREPPLGAALVMVGPSIPAGGRLAGVSMLDVAPTAAHLLGVPLTGAREVAEHRQPTRHCFVMPA